MITPKIPIKERERQKDLDSYSIIDSLSETDYDNITAIAAEICDTPISLISLIDKNRQWFKSHHGLNATETPRDIAFCAHAINNPNDILMVQDARLDERFHDNPLVLGDPNVIFYAGVPIISEEGFPLGTLCVIDNEPRILSQGQIRSLTALSNQVVNLLNLRKNKIALEKALTNLDEKNKELEKFAYIAAHDIKSPLKNISSLIKLFSDDYHSIIDTDGQILLNLIQNSSDKLKILVDGLLDYSRSEGVLKEKKSVIELATLKKEISNLFSNEEKLIIEFKTSLTEVYTNRVAIEQILINLITNAIKYNDKKITEIEIGASENDAYYEFYVKDNGIGIALDNQKKIFNIFEVTAVKDKFGQYGNGIGLATVKKIVEKSGGTIRVESILGEGSKFIFTLEK
jgi:signal transduction histidine kinase